MYISLFDMFTIGIGPSSSHTVGPMRAARRFLLELPEGVLDSVARVRVEVFGSLAHTGKGHGTDVAVLLGLAGETPDAVDPAGVPARIAAIRARKSIDLLGARPIPFDPDADLRFNLKELLPVHSNGMRMSVFGANGELLAERELYSIGGGFVVDAGEACAGAGPGDAQPVPYPYATMAELLSLGEAQGKPLDALLEANEHALHGATGTDEFIARVHDAMRRCVAKGLVMDGELPGGLRVKRRAKGIAAKLSAAPGKFGPDPMNWASAFAIAVNEENAAGGRVVTAPTNGAAGIVPAVLEYYLRFCDGDAAGVKRYFLVAAGIGALCKRNASISGAEVGCQGEVGSAAAMAAGGLAAALGAGNAQVENAAEIALEHHFGMTCDPIGGLVQVPCIERNAMGAVKAINACSLSMLGDGTHLVSLDQAIETMRLTGADMQVKYKETALGGLAITFRMAVAQPEC